MIAYLEGTPVVKGSTLLVITGGVGYQVLAGTRLLQFATIQAANTQSLSIYVYTHVREDLLELFGFANWEQRELFVLLLTVSGVGPKTALQIVDFETTKIVDAVQQANVSLFSSVPRVGKKLAQKIIIELTPKLGSLKELQLGPRSTQESDLAEALRSLGYTDEEIDAVLPKLEVTSDIAISILLKKAIRLLST
ncbi:MAG: Holliday junction branch migration protein RuvA [bacterium]|nr:Holliday junction branch migration protein RuvA [bacterium]